jgi:hypothetical protein
MRGRKSEVSIQMSGVRGQNSEVRDQGKAPEHTLSTDLTADGCSAISDRHGILAMQFHR